MICKKCGVESDGRFCPVCGSEMKRTCGYCGAELGEGSPAVCPECGAPTDGKKHCKNCGAVYTGTICMSCGVPESAFFSEEEKNAAQNAENRKKAAKLSTAKGAVYFAALCVMFLCSFFVGVRVDYERYYFAVTAIVDLFRGPFDVTYPITVLFAALGLALIVVSLVFAVKGGIAYFRGLKNQTDVALGKSVFIVYFLFNVIDSLYSAYFEMFYGSVDSSAGSGFCGTIGLIAIVTALILNLCMKTESPFKKKGTAYGLVIAAYILLLIVMGMLSDLFAALIMHYLIRGPFVDFISSLVTCVFGAVIGAMIIALAVCWVQSYYKRPLKKTLLILSSVASLFVLFFGVVFSIAFIDSYAGIVSAVGIALFWLGYLGVTIAYAIVRKRAEQ